MRRVSIDKVQNGSVVARTIYTLEGIVLLSEGARITEDIKDKLTHNGVLDVFVDDSISVGISVPHTVQEELVTDVKLKIKDMLSVPSIKASVDGKKVSEIVEKLIEAILNSGDIVAHLSDIRSIDDYTFSHSVNVCILSIVTGIGMGFKGDNLKDLATGAIMHDVGKLMITRDIIQKPSTLTTDEFTEVKKHTYYGFELLSRTNGINATAANIALSHHERTDGSGYPYSLKGSDIQLPARIVAIADVYDALTSDRVYRRKMMPHEVIDYIASLGSRHFDKNVVDTFIRHVAHFPVGTAVILNSGEKGLVSRYNPDYPNRPVVRVVIDEEGNMLYKHKEMDLSKKLEYRIVSIWDI